MNYRIREVDGHDEEVQQEIIELDRLAFGDTAPPLDEQDLLGGHWWLVTLDKSPVAYAGVRQSAQWYVAGYLNRCGVLYAHRGHGLQRRLLRVREARACRNGWEWCVTDTTDNIASANSLIKAGYTLYRPARPWGFDNTLYWRKRIVH